MNKGFVLQKIRKTVRKIGGSLQRALEVCMFSPLFQNYGEKIDISATLSNYGEKIPFQSYSS